MSSAAYRQLYILSTFSQQQAVTKADLMAKFAVSARSIQRDISSLNQFFDDENLTQQINYDAADKVFKLQTTEQQLTDAQILILIKVLLASRALNMPELKALVASLRQLVSPDQRRLVDRITNIESFDYVPLHHQQDLVQPIWQLSQAIMKGSTMKIAYEDRHHRALEKQIRPKTIFFSEFYFYVIATDVAIQQDRFYRIDRIQHLEPSLLPHVNSYQNRAEDGDVRKHVYLMYNGDVETITFEFWGIVEAALDRLPTARVIAEKPEKGSVIIQAQASDNGIRMWLLSQGNMLKVLSPQSLVEEIQDIVSQMGQLYQRQLGEDNGPQPKFII